MMYSNSSWGIHIFPDQHFAMRSIQVSHFNPVFPGISPVNLASSDIYGKSVSYVHVSGDDLFNSWSIEICSEDFLFDIVGPIHFAFNSNQKVNKKG